MDNLIGFAAFVADSLLMILQYSIIGMVIMSWLLGFGVVNRNNQLAATIWSVLQGITEPVLSPLRRILPSMGGLDLSPMIVIILIIGVRGYFLAPLRYGAFR